MSDVVQEALRKKGVFEVINSTSSENKLRITGRVSANAAAAWVIVVHAVMKKAKEENWSVDISRFYFLQNTPAGEKLFYTWRLIFQGPIEEAVAHTIQTAPLPVSVQLEEIKLGGRRTSNRNNGPRGKGAFPAGTPPLIAIQKGLK